MPPTPSEYRRPSRPPLWAVLAAWAVISPVSGQDVAGRLTLENAADPTLPIGRTTAALRVKVEGPSFTSGTDTVTVTLRCTQSADILVVKAVETEPGHFASPPVPKQEGPASVNPSLDCRDRDIIQARYIDPIYGTVAEATRIIDEPKATRMIFTKNPYDTTASDRLAEGERDSLFILVEAYGRTAGSADTLKVVMTSDQGEREHLQAVETGPHTQVFLARGPVAFVRTQPLAGNGILEARIPAGTAGDSIPLAATVTVDGVEQRKNFNLVSAQPGRSRPGGSGKDMLWWRDGTLGGRWLILHPPRSIACFDAQGAYLGEARPSSDGSVWHLPPGRAIRMVRIQAFDGTRLDRVLAP